MNPLCPSQLRNDNNKIVDLGKVAYTHLFYSNLEDNIHLRTKPRQPTVYGTPFDTDAYAIPWLLEYPLETNLERAFRFNMLDIWIPCCVVQLSNGHSLRYIGPKALSIHKTFSATVFNKNKKELCQNTKIKKQQSRL